MKWIILALVAALAATPALADTPTPGNPEADRMAAALKHHLSAHGRTFLAKEGVRLEIGDASESGAKDDVREGCPKPASCFATRSLKLQETQDAMYFLAANQAEHLLSQALERLKRNPTDPHEMLNFQQAMQQWQLMTELQSRLIKEMHDSMKNIIQKM